MMACLWFCGEKGVLRGDCGEGKQRCGGEDKLDVQKQKLPLGQVLSVCDFMSSYVVFVCVDVCIDVFL